MNSLKTLLGELASRITSIGLAAVAAALLAYFRSEAYGGIKWLLGPLTRDLPWHRKLSQTIAADTRPLRSELTVADVFLTTADGKQAVYEKTADHVVTTGSLTSYLEAVTTSGIARYFSTELGAVVNTKIEHGFTSRRLISEFH